MNYYLLRIGFQQVSCPQDPDHLRGGRHHGRGRHHGAQRDGLLFPRGQFQPDPDGGRQAAAQHGLCAHPASVGGEAHGGAEAQDSHEEAGPSPPVATTGTCGVHFKAGVPATLSLIMEKILVLSNYDDLIVYGIKQSSSVFFYFLFLMPLVTICSFARWLRALFVISLLATGGSAWTSHIHRSLFYRFCIFLTVCTLINY